jgi:hypothetical protein
MQAVAEGNQVWEKKSGMMNKVLLKLTRQKVY